MSEFTILSSEYLEWINTIKSPHSTFNPYDLSNIQLYNPLYSRVFPQSITPDNYNSITWPNHYQICGENAVYDVKTNAFMQCPTFIKFSPLLDPLRYLVGKYNYNDANLRILPNLENSNDIHSKIGHYHNQSYIDAFMCYLSSQLVTKNGFHHGLDYYGSYLAIQKYFKYDATSDIDYLSESSFFVEHLGKEFCMDLGNESLQLKCGSRGCKGKIRIVDGEEEKTLEPLNITLGQLDDFPSDISNVDEIQSSSELVLVDSFTTENNEPVLDMDTDEYDEMDNDVAECDSMLNYTDSSNPDIDADNAILDDLVELSDTESDADADDADADDDTEYTSVTDEYDDDDESVYVYIKDFPVQLICLGKCDGTLDSLLVHREINEETASAWLFQVIMALLVYQKAFQFTHNDLHTNNIMYIDTPMKYIDYQYQGVKYRVPTYGKIFKIIDFGRAIYKYNGMIFCSDSYAQGGDAYTQYNCEPFFNPNTKRIDPNYSFDLCRLACSIYLFILDCDTPENKMNNFQKTIYRWCLDDNGKNILFKQNGEERYPDFKLYKMIARHVHQHTPENQLHYPYFKQYSIQKSPKNWMKLGINVDSIPEYWMSQ